MKLQFRSTYKSIKFFPSVELPSFTVITGVNGSGKSHLLRAIASGAVGSELIKDVAADVKYFDWTSMVPRDQPAFNPHAEDTQRISAFDQLSTHQRVFGELVATAASRAGLDLEYLNDPVMISRLKDDELLGLVSTGEPAAQVKAIRSAINSASAQALSKLTNQPLQKLVQQAAINTGLPVMAILREDFFGSTAPAWGQADAFQQSFARLFSMYRKLWRENQLRQWRESRTFEKVDALSDGEFVERYNIPPWDFVNSTLFSAELDFIIDSPPEYDDVPYKPRLTKVSTNTPISFEDLSSGEKILMSLALCVYYGEDQRQVAAYPKLLLLDEIDAPLHPAMSRHLIRTVDEVLVSKLGISVIMVTHSPSTVAMAPESSLYLMIGGGGGLQKTSRDDSLNVLTAGVPTLAVSYDGRRQVFVESSVDAKVYSTLYQALRPMLPSGRSLEFVAVGTKSAAGTDVFGGVDRVLSLVNDLATAGNKSVFGLVDWDGIRSSSVRVQVLAEGARNGLESVVLDPLLLATLLIRYDWTHAEMLGVTKAKSYIEFVSSDLVELQTVADNVQRKVLGRDIDAKNRVEMKYEGGFILFIDGEYLRQDDHRLEQRVLTAFPYLHKFGTRSGDIMNYVSRNVSNDQTRFLPVEISTSFRALLQKPPH